MTNATENPGQIPANKRLLRRFLFASIFGFLLPLAVLAGGACGAVLLLKSGPEASLRAPERRARLVTIAPVTAGPAQTTICAQGIVRAAHAVAIQSRLSGEVTEISEELMPGGILRKGEMIATLDPADYELAVRQREADRGRAKSDLDIELGRQDVARREYELLGETVEVADRGLVLRKPQLDSARAALATADAALERAKLDLARTTVRAPFNALVRDRFVDVGAQVSPAKQIAELAGTDEFWIEVAVPTDRLKWIEIPGAEVRVFDEAAWGEDRYRPGTVLRQTGGLEEMGRMALLIVSVPDPFALLPENRGRPTLLLGSYLRVEIIGRGLESAITINRRHLREGGSVWVMSAAGKLEIRPVTVGFCGVDEVCLTAGLAAGEFVVTSDLSAPVEGMPLRVARRPRAEVTHGR